MGTTVSVKVDLHGLEKKCSPEAAFSRNQDAIREKRA